MRRILQFLIVIMFLVFLTGCEVLDFFVEETPQIIATGEAEVQMEAVSTLVGDLVNQPYKVAVILALGYASALLRRWYKKKQGMKG